MPKKYTPIDEDGNDIEPPIKKKKSAKSPQKKPESIDDILKRFSNTFIPQEESIREYSNDSHYTQPIQTDDEKERISALKKIITKLERRYLNSKKEDNQKLSTLEKKYAKLLNPAQLQAAITVDGPLLVVAGAGSGKTRTLVHRAAYMLERGINAKNILLLTFTRRASKEIQLRVNQLIGSEKADALTAGTFHGIANAILRRQHTLLDISPSFTIADKPDSADIIRLIRHRIKIEKKGPILKNSKIVDIFSRSRNLEISVEKTTERIQPEYLVYAEELQQLFTLFTEYKSEHNIMDYDDLLSEFQRHLEENRLFCSQMQKQFQYIMVDEFQDTNIIQKRIVNTLAAKHKNIMVVGDDAQSIYAFRGAVFENILTFPEQWKECTLIKIEQNYRSQPAIIELTNTILNAASIGYHKKLFSDKKIGDSPKLIKASSAGDEASRVVNMIEKELETIKPKDIAVLYRSGYHSTHIQTELLRRAIPFVVYGGITFTERRHIKDVISFFKIVANKRDIVAWNRLLMLLPGIGPVTARKILNAIQSGNGEALRPFFAAKQGDYLLAFIEAVTTATRPGLSLKDMCEIIFAYYIPLLSEIETDVSDRLKDLEILREISAKYRSVNSFVSDFTLDAPQKMRNNSPVSDRQIEETITLSTVHSAKGLEWHTVFVPHLLDGMFPSNRALKNFSNLEEERRLFYVACSRAKERLFLSYPATHFFGGRASGIPSRFLHEIDSLL
ncbi:ATP-dependent helicase [bacterium]|nr:ATP-dependent helicase [bacterium]